jgi:serine/threonine protein kinase
MGGRGTCPYTWLMDKTEKKSAPDKARREKAFSMHMRRTKSLSGFPVTANRIGVAGSVILPRVLFLDWMDRIGRYKIVRELGRGAMGVVYHAIDPNIGRPVAIKTINLRTGLKPEEQERMRERLFREARSAGILSHPGIVTIYDVEQQDDLAYIAMEYVDGPTLDQLLSGPEALPPDRMFSIFGQTAVALDYAHGKGIVHRDIKPANIMIAKDGTAKITDFGIAKITASEQFTVTGSIVGTPHYMSPEQVQGQTVDGRSDQFSLAVIAYEVLTGEKPYTGEHLTTVVYKIVAEEPPLPRRINSSLAGPIDATLRKGLAKKPEGRFGTCVEFTEALEKACAESKNWHAMPRGGSLNSTTVGGAQAMGAVTLPPARRAARAASASTTNETRDGKKKSGFLPFLMATLVAAGLLAFVGLETKPWRGLAHPDEPKQAETQPKQAETEPPKSQSPATTDPGAAPAAGAPVAAAPGGDPTKPSPLQTPGSTPPAVEAAKPETVAVAAPKKDTPSELPKRIPRPRPAGPQPISLISSPGGAIATLDRQADTACTTPCTIEASPGHHTLVFAKPGFDTEHRDVEVGSGPMEYPAIVLHEQQGTVMLTSEPKGAMVLVNGKRYPQLTPAQISLTPGSYKITVEWKDGKQSTHTVEVHNGINFEQFLAGR